MKVTQTSNDDLTLLRENRERIFHTLRETTKSVRERIESSYTEDDLIFRVGELTLSATYCDGKILQGLWTFSGKQEALLEPHVHTDSHEYLGLSSLSGEVHCEMGGGTRTLTRKGDMVYIPPNVEHKMLFKAGQPLAGWFVLIPPDLDFVPHRAGECILKKLGRCKKCHLIGILAGSPEKCVEK